jgi:tRNA threonylcarbamoyladenosine biosynthesis protein TsaB
MAIILHIDTATDYAGVCLSKDGELIAKEEDTNQKNHASFLQTAVQSVFQKSNHTLASIDAVAVTGGPGSYTGIRVGLSSAKGICYALNKPLIILNTLQVMAASALETIKEKNLVADDHFIIYPMIDARRMEVFGGMYNQNLLSIGQTNSLIIDDSFFNGLNKTEPILFCGNGSFKINQAQINSKQQIINSQHTVNHMIALAENAFSNQGFANLAYAEPFYVKEFYNTQQLALKSEKIL